MNMNIFILDSDPIKAAEYQCDKHVVKMCLETAQMLCTVLDDLNMTVPYKATHRKHPCTVWAAETRGNFVWLCRHGVALCKEYSKRYGKEHKCENVIKACLRLARYVPDGGLTKFAQAMPDEYKNQDAVVAYRDYYKGEKMGFAVWREGEPDWI